MRTSYLSKLNLNQPYIQQRQGELNAIKLALTLSEYRSPCCKDRKSFLILFKNSVKLLILKILKNADLTNTLTFKINNLNLHAVKYINKLRNIL